MDNLKRLVVFVHVVEEGSFAGAARRLNITNAAVSKQVITLENELKVLLLHRTTRRIELTEAGAIYYDHAKRLVGEMREIESLFQEMKAEPAGRLRVACPRHFAERYIFPYLDEFLRLYPKLTMEILIQERILDLAKEGIDVNVGHAFVGGPNDIHKKIAEVRYAFAASPEYLEKFGTPETPEDLLQHRYITHSMRIPDNVLQFRNGKEIRLEPYLRLNDGRMMIACAKRGLGIVKLHKYAIDDLLKSGELVEILKGWDTSIQPIYLCYQPQRYVHPKIRHFIDFFCAKVPREAY